MCSLQQETMSRFGLFKNEFGSSYHFDAVFSHVSKESISHTVVLFFWSERLIESIVSRTRFHTLYEGLALQATESLLNSELHHEFRGFSMTHRDLRYAESGHLFTKQSDQSALKTYFWSRYTHNRHSYSLRGKHQIFKNWYGWEGRHIESD